MPGEKCNRFPYCEDHCGEESLRVEVSKEMVEAFKNLLEEARDSLAIAHNYNLPIAKEEKEFLEKMSPALWERITARTSRKE